jgi:hypothetical protein
VVIVEMPTGDGDGQLHFRPAESFSENFATDVAALVALRESAFESNFYCLKMGSTDGPIFRGRLSDGTVITKRPARPASGLVKTPREWLP